MCETEGLIGAIQHPQDGYIQPADLTQAFARGARDRGAEINRHTRVIAIARLPSGEWKVTTASRPPSPSNRSLANSPSTSWPNSSLTAIRSA